jgi:hypothetical protein
MAEHFIIQKSPSRWNMCKKFCADLEYEKDLFPRSASAAVEADGILKLCLGLNAPQSLVGMFTNHQPAK